jgi:hypothetical protein
MPTRAAAKTVKAKKPRPPRRPAGGRAPAPPPGEDYAPLVEPLRAFALAAPSLLEALEATRVLAAPLADVVRGLQHLAASLEATSRNLAAMGAARHDGGTASPRAEARGGAGAEREVDDRIGAAQAAITAALVSLPRAEDYAPVAAQLRELATVSPSLLEWLTEVPRLSAPLAGSVRGLKQAAAELEAAREALRARR